MHGRLGTLCLAQKSYSDQHTQKTGTPESDAEQNARISRPSDLKMFVRLAIVVCGMLVAVTGVMTVAG